MRKKVRAKKGEDEAKLDLAALEAEAAATAGSSDRGSRKTGAAKQAKADADRAADEAKRQSRCALHVHVQGCVCLPFAV